MSRRGVQSPDPPHDRSRDVHGLRPTPGKYCPQAAIAGSAKKPHTLDQALCATSAAFAPPNVNSLPSRSFNRVLKNTLLGRLFKNG